MIRLSAMAGLAISAWLLWQKLNGTISSLAGCGDGSSCANVLGSRWAELFHVPVSALSALLYAGVLVLSFGRFPRLLMTAAVMLVAAAVWFTGLQALVIKSFCPWCLATHLIGLTCGIAIFLNLRSQITERGWNLVMLAGLSMSMALFLGQLFGPVPDTHQFTEEVLPENMESVVAESSSSARTVSYFEGKMNFAVDDLPHIGPIDAPHVLVKFFDYTCNSCRDMHGDLNALQASFPDQVTVVLLPAPLSRDCNPHMKPDMHDHAGACEMARLALAVWRVKPEVFAEVHELLFSTQPETEEAAREFIAHLVPNEDLDRGLKDPWVEEQLQADLAIFQKLVSANSKMPKLLVGGNVVLHGVSISTEVFVSEMSEKLELKP